MKDQQLIIAVAKLDGWILIDETHYQHWRRDGRNISGEPMLLFGKYLTSRDAIIPVIEKQDVGIQILVIQEVWLQNRPTTCHVIGSSTLEILLATPKQLSIALVKATGKWEE